MLAGRPVLGICLGMHLLADSGTEGGQRSGIGIIPGEVAKLDVSSDYRIPHVGCSMAIKGLIRPSTGSNRM